MLRGKPRKSGSTHIGDKLIIAFTILVFIASPYLSYKMIEIGMNEDIKLLQTTSDSSVAPPHRESGKIKPRRLPPFALGQVGILITAQVGMIILSGLLIQNHKRRPKPRRRD
jgi:hypothetical protein